MYATINGDVESVGAGYKSFLLSPTLQESFSVLARCLTFQYKVKANSSTLTVSTFTFTNGFLINQNVLWESPPDSDKWLTAHINILNNHYNVFGFEIYSKQDINGIVDISIDDIIMNDGNCV